MGSAEGAGAWEAAGAGERDWVAVAVVVMATEVLAAEKVVLVGEKAEKAEKVEKVAGDEQSQGSGTPLRLCERMRALLELGRECVDRWWYCPPAPQSYCSLQRIV